MSVKFMGIGSPGQIGSLQKTGKGERAKGSAGAGMDSVQFSSVLHDVKQMQSAQAGSSQRAEKVQQLKAQIEAGSYQPDLNKVASSLLQFMIEGR
ncbi:MAG: flagellar biosynthesis anti-sigma factor FlgM [Deltaproteobacteria bacterium]|nr:MAG: flagellar biosynthesis anti-sigma factor FlgM [Deltaproteobacteria bacterium]